MPIRKSRPDLYYPIPNRSHEMLHASRYAAPKCGPRCPQALRWRTRIRLLAARMVARIKAE